MDRLLNYIFLLLIIYVFALWASPIVNGALILGVVVAGLFCCFAFVMGWLTLNGAAAATVIGIIAFGLGGWATIIALLFFFISSSLISKSNTPDLKEKAGGQGFVRRDGLQVWANGFWLAVWLIMGVLTDFNMCWLAGISAIATATADTWATELGSARFEATTYLAGTFKAVPAGSEGGISAPGSIAALAGSAFIGCIGMAGFSMGAGWFFCILIAGFSGAFFDSLMGARLQEKKIQLAIPFSGPAKAIRIDNNLVNWMGTGFGALTAFLLGLLMI